MPYARLDNLKLYYEEHQPGTSPESAAPVLLFLHGFTLDHRMWTPQARFFKERYRVVLPDSRGHGFSDAPETGYSRAHRVADLQSFVNYLRISRFHLVGLSMGGTTAIGYALKHPERLASLTLVSSAAAGYQLGKGISRIDQIAREQGIAAAKQKWKEVTLSWYGRNKHQIKNLMQIMMDEHSGAIWRDLMRGGYPPENDLEQVHQITVPTLIVAGEADPVFASLARLLHEKIAGSKLIVLPGTGHMVNLEAPDRFNEELLRFVASLPTS